MQFGIGQPAPRREDRRFLTGRGRYVDDMNLPGALHGAVVRSPHAKAKILAVDIEAARAAPGVKAVWTIDDLDAAGIGDVPCHISPVAMGAPPPKFWPARPALARGEVRYVGEPVVFVVAESLDAAEDAAELVLVDYEDAAPAATIAQAEAPDAPRVWQDAEDNVCFAFEKGDAAAAKSAFEAAATTVSLQIYNNRVSPNSMEPRATVATVDPADGRLIVYTGSQNPHGIRPVLAANVFGIPETEIRVVSPDVGGGFGMKNNAFHEDVLVCHAARVLRRPVRWTSSRSEGLLNDTHGRDVLADAELALDADGRFTGLRVRARYGMGAYLSSAAPAAALLGSLLYTGVYYIPAAYLSVTAYFTNTAMVGPYRGAGRPEAIHVIERLVDLAVRETGIDPVELRRRNMLTPDRLPYTAPFGPTYDTGNFAALMDKALTAADWDGFAERAAASAKAGRKRGRGLAYFIETCGVFNDRMELRFDEGASVTILAGTHNHGQGHETVFAQLVSDWLGIPPERIRFEQGDTDKVGFGRGTYAARSMTVGGNALRDAADKVIERGKLLASVLFEAAHEDIAFDNGEFSVAGTDKKAGWSQICQAAFMRGGPTAAFGPGIEATGSFSPTTPNFPNGCHIVEVELDPDTGHVSVDRYTSVDDSGVVLNPLLYAGQIHGGIVQGWGQAMLEQVLYDEASGQLLTGSFMDYGMPRADDLPPFALDHLHIPCATNPLGIKGAGESGTVGALPAIVNAVVDALADAGVTDISMPVTPDKVWAALNPQRAG